MSLGAVSVTAADAFHREVGDARSCACQRLDRGISCDVTDAARDAAGIGNVLGLVDAWLEMKKFLPTWVVITIAGQFTIDFLRVAGPIQFQAKFHPFLGRKTFCITFLPLIQFRRCHVKIYSNFREPTLYFISCHYNTFIRDFIGLLGDLTFLFIVCQDN